MTFGMSGAGARDIQGRKFRYSGTSGRALYQAAVTGGVRALTRGRGDRDRN